MKWYDNEMVSVVMPVHNSELTLCESIGSVLAQDYGNFELILVDDCSSDNSLEVIRGYAKQYSQIRYRALSKNSGAGVARSRGISLAKGRFIAFLDSDDLWDSHKLSVQIEHIQKTGDPFVASGYRVIDSQGKCQKLRQPPEMISYRELLKENVIGCLTVVYDRNFFGTRLMPDIRKRQDYALWLKLLKDCDYCLCIQEVLASYRITPGSISSNKLQMLKYNYRMFRECENIGRFRAFGYLMRNIFRKLRQASLS